VVEATVELNQLSLTLGQRRSVILRLVADLRVTNFGVLEFEPRFWDAF